ncbi:hypothetical protein DL765_002026 [Monosporascus sp. GIB2]|nr:hypothetical protein DL765_002026 [Monosporascus sp. GIB2]
MAHSAVVPCPCGVWDLTEPDTPDAGILSGKVELPTAASFTEKYNAERHAQYLKARLRKLQAMQCMASERSARYIGISDWLSAMADKQIFLGAQMKGGDGWKGHGSSPGARPERSLRPS